jgi:hypothetical protein
MPTSKIALNYLTANRATLQLIDFPEVSFNCRNYTLPTLSLPAVNVPSPFYQGPTYGSKLLYSPLEIEFLVDENLTNYLSIHDWMRGLGAPVDKNENKQQVQKVKYTNALMTVYSSHNNPVVTFEMIQCVPVSLTGISFSEETQETTPLYATAVFEILRYEVQRKV